MNESLDKLGVTIGDFAQSIIESGDVGKSSGPIGEPETEAYVPDISNIILPENLSETISGNKVITESASKDPEPELTLTEAQELAASIAELKAIILEMKSVINNLNEMTTVGAIGVNLGGKPTEVQRKQNRGRDKFNRAVLRLKNKKSK